MAHTRAQAYDPYDSWSVDDRGRAVNALGQHRIIGYSPDRQPSRGFGGLNEHYLRQHNDGPPKAIDRAAQSMRKAGDLITKDNQRVPDNWTNRGFVTRTGANPYPVTPSPGQPQFDPKAAKDNRAFAGLPAKAPGAQPPAAQPARQQPRQQAPNINGPGPLANGGKALPGFVAAQGDGPEVDDPESTEEDSDDESDDEDSGDEGGGEIPKKPEVKAAPASKLPESPYPVAPPILGNDNSRAGDIDAGVTMGRGDGPEVETPIGDNYSLMDEVNGQGGDNNAMPLGSINSSINGSISRLPASPYPSTSRAGETMGQGDASGDKTSIGDAYSLMDERKGQEGDNITMPPGLGPLPPSRLPASPYPSTSRAGNIENAKADGSFDTKREGYNRDATGTGSRMDENGFIKPLSKTDDGTGTSPYARDKWGAGAEEIAARRDFARGEAPVKVTDPNIGPNADEMYPQPLRAEKLNPYGSSTATYGSKPVAGGTMRDHAGRAVSMSPYLQDQSLVQDSKFGKMPDAQKPLGSMDADQFKAIARGGKMPRTKPTA